MALADLECRMEGGIYPAPHGRPVTQKQHALPLNVALRRACLSAVLGKDGRKGSKPLLNSARDRARWHKNRMHSVGDDGDGLSKLISYCGAHDRTISLIGRLHRREGR